jgi:hypothetical protein
LNSPAYLCSATPPSCVAMPLHITQVAPGKLKVSLNPSLRFVRRKLRR